MISEWNPDEDEFTGSEINEVELFYADGDVCDITGKPREVVVRLKVKIYLKKFLNVCIKFKVAVRLCSWSIWIYLFSANPARAVYPYIFWSRKHVLMFLA